MKLDRSMFMQMGAGAYHSIVHEPNLQRASLSADETIFATGSADVSKDNPTMVFWQDSAAPLEIPEGEIHLILEETGEEIPLATYYPCRAGERSHIHLLPEAESPHPK